MKKNKIISVILSLVFILSVFSIPVVQGAETESSVLLNDVVYEKNSVIISGKSTLGAGEYITIKLCDSEGEVYGFGETRVKLGGKFSFTLGLPSECKGETLTAYVSDSGEIPATCQVEVPAFQIGTPVFGEAISLGTITNGTILTLNSVTYTDPSVVISGACSEGAGLTVSLSVTDKDNNTYHTATARTKSGGNYTFTVQLDKTAYDKELVANVTYSSDKASAEFIFNGGYKKNREIVSDCIAYIEELISECEGNGLSVEYEKADFGIIKKFSGFLDGYLTNGLSVEYEHNLNGIIDIADETIKNLEGYLSGKLSEKIAPKYVSSEVTMDGQSLIATVDIDGTLVNQPVFFNGLGHWSDATSDYADFADMGINYTHYEIGPSSVLKAGTNGNKYDINETAIENIKSVFKDAEDNNIRIMFMTATAYFPEFIYDNYPEINNDGSAAFPDFMPYNPTHPEVIEALTAFLNAVIPEIKDYKSFHSVCLANEPFFISHEYPDYYIDAYRDFIINKYGSLSAASIAHGEIYLSREAITMPSSISVSARYNDWREFNDSILTKWFTVLKEVMAEIDPTIPVQTKCSAYISSGAHGNRRVFCGTNYEQWSEIMDINGCDAWGIYGENGNKLQGKTMWYDFMTSLKNAPVINSEDHILRDKTEILYNEDELKMNLADVWQGAIHGRAGAVYWLWDKSSRTDEGTIYYNSNLSRRIDTVAGISRVNLDLNRLANEITAIQKKDARCAVLYSNYTQVANSNLHNAAMYEAYRTLQNNGEKVYIVNDTYPERLNENENPELLIVPCCNYLPQKVWQEIEEFIGRGKTVIFAEYNTSYYNENGKALDSTLKNSVLNDAVRVSFGGWSSDSVTLSGCQDVYAAIVNAISGYENDVTVESSNGETEWTAAKYESGYVVNLCNLGDETTDITVSLNGEECGELFDLTQNKEVSNKISLAPYETKLIKIEGSEEIKDGMSFWYSDGSEALEVKADTISSKAKTTVGAGEGFVHILAVYSKGNVLKSILTNDGFADENGNILSEISITVKENEVSDMVLKSYLFNSLGRLEPYLPSAELGVE
ncbi:MAG: hypothetical protein E7415_01545 [Ruminococcaceae bacterium]|nr:hypothetical protein [Oscillospiraceae bacterium]